MSLNLLLHQMLKDASRIKLAMPDRGACSQKCRLYLHRIIFKVIDAFASCKAANFLDCDDVIKVTGYKTMYGTVPSWCCGAWSRTEQSINTSTSLPSLLLLWLWVPPLLLCLATWNAPIGAFNMKSPLMAALMFFILIGLYLIISIRINSMSWDVLWTY